MNKFFVISSLLALLAASSGCAGKTPGSESKIACYKNDFCYDMGSVVYSGDGLVVGFNGYDKSDGHNVVVVIDCVDATIFLKDETGEEYAKKFDSFHPQSFAAFLCKKAGQAS